MAEDEMVEWHHQLSGYECQQTPGKSEGQGSLVCCSPCGHKELNTTEQLNRNKYLGRDPEYNILKGVNLRLLLICSRAIGKVLSQVK